MSHSLGTLCASGEFPAPKFVWTFKPGWRAVWPPFLAGDLVLAGCCNNGDNAGLSAFHELPSGELLWIYPRTNGAVFTVLTQSEKEQTSYLNGLSRELDPLLWRNDGFRSSCKDQPGPPTRQRHAIDLSTGKTLW
jgi:hypothetical protein